jgi:hypothetical protein
MLNLSVNSLLRAQMPCSHLFTNFPYLNHLSWFIVFLTSLQYTRYTHTPCTLLCCTHFAILHSVLSNLSLQVGSQLYRSQITLSGSHSKTPVLLALRSVHATFYSSTAFPVLQEDSSSVCLCHIIGRTHMLTELVLPVVDLHCGFPSSPTSPLL